jgi:hypothetical protein
MSAVRAAIAALRDVFPVVEFVNTGGGCHAIECLLDADLGTAGGYVLVTDSEDVFVGADLDSDDEVHGYCADEHDPAGDSRTDCEGFYHRHGLDADAIPGLIAACEDRFGRVAS